MNDTTPPITDHLLTHSNCPAPEERATGDDTARLVADVLGTSKARSEAILSVIGGLAGLSHASEPELFAASVAVKRVRTLRAAFELARASVGTRPKVGHRLGDAGEVWRHMRARLEGCPVEEFWVIAVNVRHRVILDQMLARGSLVGVEVHPRDVFRPLIKAGAAAAIFCHNHPSGDPGPSRQDIDLTTRLREVGELCGIAVLGDHVVVGWEGYVSLAQRDWRQSRSRPCPGQCPSVATRRP